MSKKLFLLFAFIVMASFSFAQVNKIKEKYRLANEYKSRASERIVSNYGNTQNVTYTVDSILYATYPFTGTQVLNGTDDLWSQFLPIGFNFCYYGVTYDSLVIGGNGEVTFDKSEAGMYDGWTVSQALPNTVDVPANTICVAFRDIDPSQSGNILYQLYGTSPNRTLVINWVNIPLFDMSTACTGTSNSTFQVALYESSGVIETYIQNSASCNGWNGGYGIIGLEDQTGTVAACPPNRNYPNKWTAVNEAWQFVPSNNSCYTSCGSVPNNLCFVNTNSNLQNDIFFNHTLTPGAVGTIIYRLNGSSNWDSIGFVSNSQPDEFLDLTANPNQQNYSYCISSIDSCNNISTKSSVHTTIFLQTSLGTGSAINLSWNAYVGIPVTSYYIYRGPNTSSMSLINQVSSSNLAYTDLSPPVGTNYYKVEIMAPASCTSNAPHDTLVGSNYKVNGTTSVNSENNSEFNLSPNPSNGQITITTVNGDGEIKIRDILGKIIYEGKLNVKETKLHIEVAGIYFVTIMSSGYSYTKKMVVN